MPMMPIMLRIAGQQDGGFSSAEWVTTANGNLVEIATVMEETKQLEANEDTETLFVVDEMNDDGENDLSESDEGETEDNVDPGKLPRAEVVILIHNQQTGEDELFRALLDSGTTRCLGTETAIHKAGLRIHPSKRSHRYRTALGEFKTDFKARIRTHQLVELSSRRKLKSVFVQVTDDLGPYDFIFGTDYLTKFGINLLFDEQVISWDGIEQPMKISGDWNEEFAKAYLNNDELVDEWEDEAFLQQILDSKYEKSDLPRVAAAQEHLSKQQQQQLEQVLLKHQEIFQGTLGKWPGVEITATVEKDAQPYHCKQPYRLPHSLMDVTKREVERLVEIGVLEPVAFEDVGPWCCASFVIPKKNNRVRFITDLRKVNQAIDSKPYPIPHILDMIQDIGPYTYVSALDLSMAFYHMELSEELKQMCTFVLPWGYYRYARMPMGLSISPFFLQAHLSQLFTDLSFVKTFMDDLLVYSNGSYEDHVAKVNQVLTRLQSKNLQVNADKSFWAVKEVEYLGFILTPTGMKPQPRKIKAIVNMDRPRNRKELRKFIGMINYYRHMWKQRSHLLAPLTKLTSNKGQFLWKEEQQKAFDELKRVVSKEVMLSFPDYSRSEGFEIYVDASDLQLGAVLRQGEKTLAFYSRKLNPAQRNYSVGEKEMLSIVEALKEFRTCVWISCDYPH